MANKYLTQKEFNEFKEELFARLDEAREEDRKYFEEMIDNKFATHTKNLLPKKNSLLLWQS